MKTLLDLYGGNGGVSAAVLAAGDALTIGLCARPMTEKEVDAIYRAHHVWLSVLHGWWKPAPDPWPTHEAKGYGYPE